MDNLEIKVISVSDLFANHSLLKRIKALTFGFNGGMQFALREFYSINLTREVNAKILIAYKGKGIVGWALISNEPSSFRFGNISNDPKSFGAITIRGFRGKRGTLFEVFVRSKYRRMGIGSALIEKAKSLSGRRKLFVSRHDVRSNSFFINHNDLILRNS